MNNKNWYVADFETTSERFYNSNGYTRVWLFSICDSKANIIKDGHTILEFMTFVKTLKGSTIYFHNLKFDGNFILDYLLNNGYEYKDDLKVHDDKGFSCLIGDMGEFYEIKVNYTKACQVKFNDSMKLIASSVDRIAKDFKLPILKEKIDYDNYEINDEKLEYIHHDVQIVAMALSTIKEEGMTRMTAASCAYHCYDIMMNNDEYMNRLFPQLDLDFLINWRTAYRGGRSQVNPMYQDKVVHNIKRFDINSMYPSILRNAYLPYGKPIIIDKPNKYKFELYDIDIGFTLKKGHLPSLLKKASFLNIEGSYYTVTDGVESMRISNIDLELVKRNYNIYYLKYNSLCGFLTSRMMFREYIDYWYEKKKNSKGAVREVCKKMLNCLYGKYGSKPEGFHKIPILNDGIVSFINSPKEEMKKYYLPVAIAVTSYAHMLLDDGIQATGISNFVYCDTDSIHTLGTLPASLVSQTELGLYKLEANEKTAKYVRQKCYVTQSDDDITEENPTGYNITCAGMPANLKNTCITEAKDNIFKVFEVGLKVEGKLMPKHVKGGIILHASTFEIKSQFNLL